MQTDVTVTCLLIDFFFLVLYMRNTLSLIGYEHRPIWMNRGDDLGEFPCDIIQQLLQGIFYIQ